MEAERDFTDYVAARGHRLVRSAVLMGCSVPEAEDAVQTALTRCYVSWRKVQAATDVDAYVYRTLVNCLSSGRRRRWTAEIPTADVPDRIGVDDADRMAVGASVRAALTAMSVPHRTVLVLRYYADLTDPQIADVLGLPVGTIKSRLSRATHQLAADPRLAGLTGREHTT